MKRRIIVDADSNPLKKEIIKIGHKYSTPVFFVASFSHYMGEIEGATFYYVDNISQAADLFIANLIKSGDIVITDDYGLASMVLRKDIRAISSRGVEYTDSNIDILLANRDYTAKSLRSGKKVKGPKPFTKEDRAKFVETLEEILNF